MPEEQTYVTTYKLGAGVPMDFDKISVGPQSEEDPEIYQYTVKLDTEHSSCRIEELLEYLRKLGALAAPYVNRYGSVSDFFREELLGKLCSIGALGSNVHYVNPREFHVKTPASEAQSEHIRKRKLLEIWLREKGIEYTVSCATLHSSASCRLAV